MGWTLLLLLHRNILVWLHMVGHKSTHVICAFISLCLLLLFCSTPIFILRWFDKPIIRQHMNDFLDIVVQSFSSLNKESSDFLQLVYCLNLFLYLQNLEQFIKIVFSKWITRFKDCFKPIKELSLSLVNFLHTLALIR